MSVQSGITAYSGGGQENAVQLAATFCQVSTSAAHGDSVKLPLDIVGPIKIRNDGANDVAVYPQTGGQIDGLGANAAYYLASGSVQEFVQTSATQWYTTNKSLRFVRLDPSAAHFSEANFGTHDGSWVDLSLAAIVPPSGRGKLCQVKMDVADGTGGKYLRFRKNGASNAAAQILTKTIAAGGNACQGLVETDVNGVVEYAQSADITTISVAINGYFVEG